MSIKGNFTFCNSSLGIFSISFVVTPFVALQAVLVLVIDPLVADMLQIEVRVPI
jgi:hypothetical protein